MGFVRVFVGEFRDGRAAGGSGRAASRTKDSGRGEGRRTFGAGSAEEGRGGAGCGERRGIVRKQRERRSGRPLRSTRLKGLDDRGPFQGSRPASAGAMPDRDDLQRIPRRKRLQPNRRMFRYIFGAGPRGGSGRCGGSPRQTDPSGGPRPCWTLGEESSPKSLIEILCGPAASGGRRGRFGRRVSGTSGGTASVEGLRRRLEGCAKGALSRFVPSSWWPRTRTKSKLKKRKATHARFRPPRPMNPSWGPQ